MDSHMAGYKIEKFPKSRIATIDVCAVGRQKHHVAAMIEIDVTESRKKIKKYKTEINKISFTAWLIKVISITIKDYDRVASFLQGNKRVIIFDDISMSLVVEKEIDGQKVPIPLLIEKANERSIESISKQISDAKNEIITEKNIVLERRANLLEQVYYLLPGFIRRFFWRFLLKRPHFAFMKMGNVAVTSLGMTRSINGWFIPISVHPICFGIGSITKKPVVVDDNIVIRDILNMTILVDHDVIDGAPMVRFISELSDNIEKGMEL
ncbi:MAG: 2-oxo acid dehydrogenase subunit E2 [Bacteroidales bacterium]|nr:2-oxo acid dehydrogenase subunit E2 [Bacteroidales bacterium]MDD4293243.1 2-oxo acid dehydrogenase subunit E2 [Bacteroidales bacterium]